MRQVIDCLFTARWALNSDKPQHAYDKVTEALEILGAIAPKSPTNDQDRPNDPMPEDFNEGIVEPRIVKVKGVSFRGGKYRTPGGNFKGLVVHYTVSNNTASSAIGVVKYLASKGYGCMVMDKDGIIYIPEDFDILKDFAAHAGNSKWGNDTGLNDEYAGIEICCYGKGSKVGPYRESKGEANIIAGKYQVFTQQQEKALMDFCLWALSVNPDFSLDRVCGHDEARTEFGRKGDKSDPGASLSVTMPEFRRLVKERAKILKLIK